MAHHNRRAVLDRFIPRKIIPKRLRDLARFERALHVEYGWLRSWLLSRPVDARGEPVPWMTYPAIEFLRQFDFRSGAVLEWGAGYSTLWWAARARRVVSVETNAAWVARLRERAPANVEMITTAPTVQGAMRALNASEDTFDVIVVDNEAELRLTCCRSSVAKLKSGGILVLDNSDRAPRSAEVLRRAGLLQVDFIGFAPASVLPRATSVFFNGPSSLRPWGERQPSPGVAQPDAPWPGA